MAGCIKIPNTHVVILWKQLIFGILNHNSTASGVLPRRSWRDPPAFTAHLKRFHIVDASQQPINKLNLPRGGEYFLRASAGNKPFGRDQPRETAPSFRSFGGHSISNVLDFNSATGKSASTAQAMISFLLGCTSAPKSRTRAWLRSQLFRKFAFCSNERVLALFIFSFRDRPRRKNLSWPRTDRRDEPGARAAPAPIS